jgi:predicted phosphodiesterase
MILFLGDVHSHFDHVEKAIDTAKIKPKAVVFLGDVEAPIPFEDCIEGILKRDVEVYWIRGNHDTDTDENWSNLHGSMDRNIDGRIVAVDGLRIAGLGGVFRGEVWHPEVDSGKPTHRNYAEYERWIRSNRNLKQRLTKKDLVQLQAVPEQKHWAANVLDASRTGKLLKHRSTIWPDTYEKLADMRADILLTHEAPSCHPHGFETIDLLARQMGVRAAFHGHHHDCLDYIDAMGFRAYGVGFCGITSFDPKTGLVENVAPGDFDEARRYRQQHVIERE